MGIDKELKYQIDYKLKTALDFENNGKLLHAVQIYRGLIKDYPDYTDAYFKLAEAYEKSKNIKPAISLLKEFLSRYPGNKEVRLFLGQCLLRNALWEEANNIFSFILPEEEPLVSFFMGYSHFMLEEYELAKINFLNFISFKDQSELLHEAYLYMAKTEIELKDYERSLSFAKKAELMYGNFWELNLVFAIAYFNLSMFAHAIIPVERAIKLNPNYALARKWAGNIYLKSGDFLKAVDNFLKFLELSEETSAEIYTNLGEACFKARKAKDALAYFEMALKLEPENKFALTGKENATSELKKNKIYNG